MPGVEIVENIFARVEIDRDTRLVKLIRTANQLKPELVAQVVEDFQLAVPLRERPRLVLLQDMRLGPMIRDEALDRALMAVVPKLVAKFAARAMLLASPVGVLQANRFTRESGSDVRAFVDEIEALRYLHGEIAKLRASK